MPQFDPSVFAPQLVWLVIAFGVFYLAMARFGLPTVSRVLEERVERVAEDRDQAESLRHESEEARRARDAALADARRKAAETVAAAEARAREEAAKKLADLDAALGRTLDTASANIAATREAARDEVASIAGEACRAVVGKLTGAEIERAAADKAIAALRHAGEKSA